MYTLQTASMRPTGSNLKNVRHHYHIETGPPALVLEILTGPRFCTPSYKCLCVAGMKRPFVASSSGDLPAVIVNRLIDLSRWPTDGFVKPRHDPKNALLFEVTFVEGLLTTDCRTEVEGVQAARAAATEVAMF